MMRFAYKTPFLYPQTRSELKFKCTRSNFFFVQRIYFRLKFSVEMNGCIHISISRIEICQKNCYQQVGQHRRKENNSRHLTGVHYIRFYTFAVSLKDLISLFFLFEKKTTFSFWNDYFYNTFATISSLLMSYQYKLWTQKF